MSPFAAFRHFSWVLCVSLLPDSVRRFCLVAIYLCFDGLPPRKECPETNYIGQSVAGMLIFYGTGLGWGTSANLLYTELIEGAVYSIQQFFSNL